MTKLLTGWDRFGRDFTKEEFNKSYIKKNWGGKLTYEKYLEARVREKLNEKRRKRYAEKKKMMSKGDRLDALDRKVRKMVGGF